MAMNHAREADCDVEIACRRDGTILGLRGEVFVDIGAYVRTNGADPAAHRRAVLQRALPRAEHPASTSTLLLTNKTPSGTYRGARPFRGVVLLRADDRAWRRAISASTAPSCRRRNLIAAAEMPYPLARLEPGGAGGGSECDSGDYRETLDRCLAEFGWAEKRALQGRLIDGRYHGFAVACFIEGGGAGPKETARLELDPDGTVSVYVGSTAVGQGLETVIAQIAADTLGLPLDQVRVLHGSTPYLQEGYGAFASRSTVLGGSAVFEAREGAAREASGKRPPLGSAFPPPKSSW